MSSKVLDLSYRSDSDYLVSPRQLWHILGVEGQADDYSEYPGDAENEKLLQSFQVDIEYSGNGMYLGTGCRKYTLKFIDNEKQLSWVDYGVRIAFAFGAGNFTSIGNSGGEFEGYVTEVTRDDTTNEVTVIAYDKMYFLSQLRFWDIIPVGTTTITPRQILNAVSLSFNSTNFPKLYLFQASVNKISNYFDRLDEVINISDINISDDSNISVREVLTQLGLYLGACIMQGTIYTQSRYFQIYKFSEIRGAELKTYNDLWNDKSYAHNLDKIGRRFIATQYDPWIMISDANKLKDISTSDKRFKYRYCVVNCLMGRDTSHNQYPKYAVAIYVNNLDGEYEAIRDYVETDSEYTQLIFDLQDKKLFNNNSFRFDVLEHAEDEQGHTHEISAGDDIFIYDIIFTDTLEIVNYDAEQEVFKQGVNNQQIPLHITQSDYYEFKHGEDNTLTQVAHKNELENIVITGTTAGYCQVLDNNIFLSKLEDEDIQDKLDILVSDAPQITNYDIDWIGVGNLNFGTNLIIDVNDGDEGIETVVTPYIPKTIIYDGGLKFTSSFDIGEVNQNIQTAPTSISDSLKTTRAIVDKVNQEILLEVGRRESADKELSSRIEVNATGITAVASQITGLTTKVANVELTATGLTTTVRELSGVVGGFESRIEQTSKDISLLVTTITGPTGEQRVVNGASLILAINNDESSEIKISADKISITGFVTFDDLSGTGTHTFINGGNINTNSIEAESIKSHSITADQISAGAITAREISANAITAGAISANAITAGSISANAITADKISAGAITSELIGAETITGGNIKANSITAEEIDASTIIANDFLVQASSGSTGTTQLSARLNGIEASIVSSEGNSTYRQASQPTGVELKIGDLWCDTSNNKNVWKRWNGSRWEDADGSEAVRTELVTQVNILTGQISSRVLQTDYNIKMGEVDLKFITQESSIKQTSKDISLLVTGSSTSRQIRGASIIAAINDDGSQVTIDADKIDLNGVTTFIKPGDLSATGSTVINGGRIETHTLSANTIAGGTITGVEISGVQINGVNISGVNISGATINSEGIETDIIRVSDTLNVGMGDSITGGRIYSDNIYGGIYAKSLNYKGIVINTTGATTSTVTIQSPFSSYSQVNAYKDRIGIGYPLSKVINSTQTIDATVTYKDSNNVRYTTNVPVTFYQGSNGGAGSVLVDHITGGRIVSVTTYSNTLTDYSYSGLTGAFNLDIGTHTITAQHILPDHTEQSAVESLKANLGILDKPFNNTYTQNLYTNSIYPMQLTGTLNIGTIAGNINIGKYQSQQYSGAVPLQINMTGRQSTDTLVIDNIRLTNKGIEYIDNTYYPPIEMTCTWSDIVYAIKRTNNL